MRNRSHYIMEDPRESERLLDKVDPVAWNRRFLEAHLRDETTVVSVGCGPGVFLREVATMHPRVRFVGVDISRDRIRDARRRLRGLSNVDARTGSCDALPLQSDEAHLIFARFLLQFVRNKEQAIQEMIRVCQPSGTVLLQDLDGQLIWHYPEDRELQETVESVVRGLRATGFDPFVGRKLYHLCHQAGLVNIAVNVEPYHLYAGRIAERDLQHWRKKLDIAAPLLENILGKAAAARYTGRFLEYLQRRDTLTYSCLFTVTAQKPSNPA